MATNGQLRDVSLVARLIGPITSMPQNAIESADEAVDVMASLAAAGVGGMNHVFHDVQTGVLLSLIWHYGDNRDLAVIMERREPGRWRIEAMGVGVDSQSVEYEFAATMRHLVAVTAYRDTVVDYGPDKVMRIFANTFGNMVEETARDAEPTGYQG